MLLSIRSCYLFLLTYFCLSLFSSAFSASSFPSASVRILSQTGAIHHFSTELASTPIHRQQGLMFRETLAPDHGMLFIFETDSILSMWMKNTLIPLDMIFIAHNGTVVSITENTTPESLKTIQSTSPARMVLELAGGTVQRLNIQIGDRLEWETIH